MAAVAFGVQREAQHAAVEGLGGGEVASVEHGFEDRVRGIVSFQAIGALRWVPARRIAALA